MVSVRPSNFINEYYGLSTDTKPTFEKTTNVSFLPKKLNTKLIETL